MADSLPADQDDLDSRPAAKRRRTSETKLDDLPNELLTEIFAYLGGIDTARVQRVCRRFCQVTQALKAVWQGPASIVSEDVSCKEICQLLRTAVESNKNRAIHAVEIDFRSIGDRDISTSQDFEAFSKLVGELDVYHLRVEWLGTFDADFERGFVHFMSDIFSRRSTRIESLDIRDLHEVMREEDSNMWPPIDPALNTLRRLRVLGGGVPINLRPLNLPSLYLNLTHVHFKSIKTDKGARGIYLILRAARKSLRVLNLHLDDGSMPFARNMKDDMSKRSHTIVFRKLVKLDLTSDYYECREEVENRQVYHFSCPRLRESLFLNCKILNPFASLMASTLKCVTIHSEMLWSQCSLRILSRCPDLQALVVAGFWPTNWLGPLDRARLKSIFDVGMETLVFPGSDTVPNNMFVALLRTRIRINPRAMPQRIIFYNSSSFPQHQALYEDIQRILPGSIMF